MKKITQIKKEYYVLIDNLPKFLNQLKNELKIELNYTEEEIGIVESWFNDKRLMYIDKPEYEDIKKMFFSYCSSAFISSNGGEIVLDTKKKNMSYGEPIIVNYGGVDYPWVAISIFDWIRVIQSRGLKKSLSLTILRNLKSSESV